VCCIVLQRVGSGHCLHLLPRPRQTDRNQNTRCFQWCIYQLLICATHCNSVLQCVTATVCCTVSLQQCVALCHCNSVLQCVTATVCCSVSLQQCVAVCHCNSIRISLLFICATETLCDTLQITATYCNTLQHAATQCNMLQRTATHCNTLQHTATHCRTLQHNATQCNTMQHTHCNPPQHTHCNKMQHAAPHCNILQHTATHCITLQHIATHCNTLQDAAHVVCTPHTPPCRCYISILSWVASWATPGRIEVMCGGRRHPRKNRNVASIWGCVGGADNVCTHTTSILSWVANTQLHH